MIFTLIDTCWRAGHLVGSKPYALVGGAWLSMILAIILDFHYGNFIYRGCYHFVLMAMAVFYGYFEMIENEFCRVSERYAAAPRIRTMC